jgi:hypothetical protein
MSGARSYYIVRTPQHRKAGRNKFDGFRRTNKRDAISLAKFMARTWMNEGRTVSARRVDLYTIERGWRPTLLFQCHWSRKFKRVISEEL